MRSLGYILNNICVPEDTENVKQNHDAPVTHLSESSMFAKACQTCNL